MYELIERTRMSLSVGDHTNFFQVSTSGNNIQVPCEISNLYSFQINLNGVIYLAEGIRVAVGVNITDCQVRDSPCVLKDPSHFAQLVLGLIRCNTMESKAIFGVIEEIDILFSLANAEISVKPTG